jgi:hypothetical protein
VVQAFALPAGPQKCAFLMGKHTHREKKKKEKEKEEKRKKSLREGPRAPCTAMANILRLL